MSVHSAYEEWHELHAVDEGADAPWHRLLKAYMDPHEDLADRRILEIGCGRGGLSCWLASRSPRPSEIVAADFSRTAVEKGRRFAADHNLTGIKWELGDIEAIAHPNASFDTVISCETIEHVPTPRRALRELARVLRPGGRLFLTTPNYLGTMGLYRMYTRLRGRRFTEEGQPINHPLILPITAAWVRNAGLIVRTVDAIGHYLPLPGRPPLPMPFLEHRWMSRWFGLHSLIVAQRLV